MDGLSLGETEGFGVRVLVDGAWGFASSGRMDGRAADDVAGLAVRIARASARHARGPVSLADRPPAAGPLRDARGARIPSRCPSTAPWACSSRPSAPWPPCPASRPRPRPTTTPSASGRSFQATDGSRDRAGHHPRRCRAGGRRPPARTTCSGAAIPSRAATGPRATSTSARLDLVERAPALAEEAVALLSAPVLPPGRRTIVLHPSQLYLQIHESCGHPTELDRVFGTEAAYAGTSFLTTDKLESGLPLRLRPGDPRRRRHHARRPGHLRLGRRGRRRAARAARQRGHLQRLPDQPRDGASHRPQQRRGRARRRLEPAAAHPHDQHQPRAAPGHEPGGHHRRHR